MPGARPAFEVADIFRQHGDAFRVAHAGHLSRSQLRVMGAIEACRTAALGGHVECCVDCRHQRISYNSCRDRHCPKCQSTAAREWLSARAADLLPVEYFHVVFTLPAPVAAIAYHNKATVYAMLFEAAAETLKTIAADERYLGAEIGAIMVLHTWGQTLTHHPHVHCIVPGGGLSAHGDRWIACRPGFFLPVRVLSRLYHRLFLEKLRAAYRADKLPFFGNLKHLSDHSAFDTVLTSLRRIEWLVYAKRPFAGPKQVLAYLARYTHRVAISNHRLLAVDNDGATFSWRDYRDGARMKSMTLAADEFIRRFLLHVLPDGFQRIRHYGFLANGHRRAKLMLIRRLLAATPPSIADQAPEQQPACAVADTSERPPCPCCGSRMVVIEILPGPRRGNLTPDTS
ncbi:MULTISPECIES: IS91 family transposase [unclassified Bradyrhizobium]